MKSTRKQKAAPKAPFTAPRTVTLPASRHVLIIGIASIVLLVLCLVPWGPFAFLPKVLAWPLAGAALAGWWLAEAGSRGLIKIPAKLAGTVAEACCLTLIFGSYGLLKLGGLHPSGTDDNIYFYGASRMTQGLMPYRDFFFAHPPVHLLIPAAVFSITGFSIGIAKAIPAIAQGLAGLFLYLTVRKASKPLALVALLLHLTAYEVLMGSTDMNGENIMAAFLMASLFAASCRYFMLSGVLAGLGLGSGLYALAAVLALAAGALSASRKALIRYGIGFAATLLIVMTVFSVIGGHNFWEGVILFHLSKPLKGSDRISLFASGNPFAMAGALIHNFGVWFTDPIFKKSLYFHAPSYLGFLTGAGILISNAVGAWLRPESTPEPWYARLMMRDMLSGSAEGLVKFSILAVLLFMLQWAALNEIYDYYTVPMIVLLSVPAAYALMRAWEALRDAHQFRQAFFPAILAGLFCLHVPWAASLNRALWPDELRDAGKQVTYQWRDPWALAGLSGITQTLFFAENRIKGDVTPYYRHFVWNKLLTFSTVNDIAAYIRANTSQDDIAGASVFTPLVALYAGRRLAADESDTNAKRFSSGILTSDTLFDKLCSDRIRYIVSAEKSLFNTEFMASNPVAKKYFSREREFLDPQLAHFRDTRITLYRRNDIPGLPDGKVCLSQ